MARYVFITGGVASSLGKGVAAAALAALLQARGYTVKVRKLDPYLNVDPGTMSPEQHGEVFVTDDGAETDLDLGHYERFTGRPATSRDSVSAGRIYSGVLERERRGDFLGATIQVVPHVTDAIKEFALRDGDAFDFVICEIGGTVGDIEAMPFLEAIRQLRNDLPRNGSVLVHLALLPWIPSAGELKTKPAQHSVRVLQSAGLSPDVLLVRTDRPVPEEERAKLSRFCNVRPSSVIQALDVAHVYDVPEAYRAEGFDAEVLEAFGIDAAPRARMEPWAEAVSRMREVRGHVRIAVVAKYALKDAYRSLAEALLHGGMANRTGVVVEWLDAEEVEGRADDALAGFDGVVVPGGFGARGTQGKIDAIRSAREGGTPFLGICLGMQLACIEAARAAGIPGASSTEFGPCAEPVVDVMSAWTDRDGAEKAASGGMGGTMRLGAYPARLVPGTAVAAAYGGADEISERHRHRYEVDVSYRDRLEAAGLVFSAMSPDGRLPEAVEWKGHPFFVGVQFHPELKSGPLSPHPLFAAFVRAAAAAKETEARAA